MLDLKGARGTWTGASDTGPAGVKIAAELDGGLIPRPRRSGDLTALPQCVRKVADKTSISARHLGDSAACVTVRRYNNLW